MKNEFYSSKSFPLLLSHLAEGGALFAEAPTASFNYYYNVRTHEGQAQLVYLDKSTLALRLYPTLENTLLVFTSNMQPTTYTLSGKAIVLNTVILKIDLENDIQSAAMIFNHKGDVLYTTANYHQMGIANG
ncbi:hypothetical protein [Rasiella sp. SM2506]|uniref:hypothetical protein n=1 Tax=Rasiella sp. SM2506 TaxID=3423914 RepID=UPI003D7B41EA